MKFEEIDKIFGFEFGVDDYIIKFFSVKELVVRVKVFLRRVESLKFEVEDKVKFGDVEVDFLKRIVKKNN